VLPHALPGCTKIDKKHYFRTESDSSPLTHESCQLLEGAQHVYIFVNMEDANIESRSGAEYGSGMAANRVFQTAVLGEKAKAKSLFLQKDRGGGKNPYLNIFKWNEVEVRRSAQINKLIEHIADMLKPTVQESDTVDIIRKSIRDSIHVMSEDEIGAICRQGYMSPSQKPTVSPTYAPQLNTELEILRLRYEQEMAILRFEAEQRELRDTAIREESARRREEDQKQQREDREADQKQQRENREADQKQQREQQNFLLAIFLRSVSPAPAPPSSSP
jgi:hypothetical protein